MLEICSGSNGAAETRRPASAAAGACRRNGVAAAPPPYRPAPSFALRTQPDGDAGVGAGDAAVPGPASPDASPALLSRSDSYKMANDDKVFTEFYLVFSMERARSGANLVQLKTSSSFLV